MRILFSVIMILSASVLYAQDSSNFTRSEIIYGRKDGMALTMIQLKPVKNPRGKAIISLVSGNWISGYSMVPSAIRRSATYIDNGYTVFLVMHGSQPRYAIPDETADVRRAVRFIRYNASEYGIDSSRIGITGASSGGHLSLMTALVDEKISSTSSDPVERVSSRVQAVAVFFPPTDFLNWGGADAKVQKDMIRRARVGGAFDFKKMNDSLGIYESVKGDSASLAIARTISPIYFVTADDPPVMISHGDKDPVVPLQQSETIIKKLNDAGVPNEFILKPGGSHGWRNIEEEEKKFVAWFDKWLK